MTSSFKAVLFDLDGTILNRTESLRDFAIWQSKGMLRNSVLNPDQFCQRFIELDSNGLVWKDKVYSALVEEFASLKEHGYKLGLVTNGRSPFQERNFNALGVSDLFDSVVVSEAVGYQKPQGEIFEIACQELGVAPEQSVFVGDNPISDIDGANNYGMYTIYVPGSYGETYENANISCSDFSRLPNIVQGANYTPL